MTIIKAFTVPNEANRKKRETQRKAVLWSRKVFKSLPKAGCIFNAPCIDCAVLRRFTYQGLTRWVITLQTKKRVWQEVHSKCCSTWTAARRETALSPSWDEWQSTGLWRSSVANKVFSDNGRLILTILTCDLLWNGSRSSLRSCSKGYTDLYHRKGKIGEWNCNHITSFFIQVKHFVYGSTRSSAENSVILWALK